MTTQSDVSINDITEPLERELRETKEKLRKAVEFIRGLSGLGETWPAELMQWAEAETASITKEANRIVKNTVKDWDCEQLDCYVDATSVPDHPFDSVDFDRILRDVDGMP